jgi:hypothetical protein
MRASLVQEQGDGQEADNRSVASSDQESGGQTLDEFGAAASLPALLHAATRGFVEAVDGTACAISRLVGDVLIQVAEFARDDRTLVLGHGYLISDFPLTKEALEDDKPRTASLLDDDCDANEAALLRELELDSLLMLPLRSSAGPWGLAEVYVNGRPFDDDDVARAEPLAEAFGERVADLPAPASPS